MVEDGHAPPLSLVTEFTNVRNLRIFRKIKRTNGRSDTLMEVNETFAPRWGIVETGVTENDPFKTKPHTLIAGGVAVLHSICSTGE